MLLLVLGLTGLAVGLGPWSLVVSAAGIAVVLLSLQRNATNDAQDTGDVKAALHEAAGDLGIQWSNDDALVQGAESWISEVRTAVSVHNDQVKEYQDLAARKGVQTVQALELETRGCVHGSKRSKPSSVLRSNRPSQVGSPGFNGK